MIIEEHCFVYFVLSVQPEVIHSCSHSNWKESRPICMAVQINRRWCCGNYITLSYLGALTHWGRVTHICVVNLTIIGSDNGLSPGRRQAIIWTNDAIVWIRPLGTNFSETLIEFLTFWFKKMRLNVSSAKWWSFRFGFNVLTYPCSKLNTNLGQ